MKMIPITFQMEFCDTVPSCAIGFKPFTDEQHRYVERMIVRLEPFKWNKGYGGIFSIIEEFYVRNEGGKHHSKLCNNTIFDKDMVVLESRWIAQALSNNDARQPLNEDLAYRLFWNEFAFGPEMHKYLPRAVEALEKMRDAALRS